MYQGLLNSLKLLLRIFIILVEFIELGFVLCKFISLIIPVRVPLKSPINVPAFILPDNWRSPFICIEPVPLGSKIILPLSPVALIVKPFVVSFTITSVLIFLLPLSSSFNIDLLLIYNVLELK